MGWISRKDEGTILCVLLNFSNESSQAKIAQSSNASLCIRLAKKWKWIIALHSMNCIFAEWESGKISGFWLHKSGIINLIFNLNRAPMIRAARARITLKMGWQACGVNEGTLKCDERDTLKPFECDASFDGVRRHLCARTHTHKKKEKNAPQLVGHSIHLNKFTIKYNNNYYYKSLSGAAAATHNIDLKAEQQHQRTHTKTTTATWNENDKWWITFVDWNIPKRAPSVSQFRCHSLMWRSRRVGWRVQEWTEVHKFTSYWI